MIITETGNEFQSETEVKEFNASKIVIEEKLSDNIKQDIKKRFNAYCNEKFVWTIPINQKIPLESYLNKEEVVFSLQDTYEQFHSLSSSEQRAERLEQAQMFIIKQGYTDLSNLREYIDDYNSSWNTNLKISDFEGKSIDDIRNLAYSNDSKEVAHLDILLEMHAKLKKKHDKTKQLHRKIKTLKEGQKGKTDNRLTSLGLNQSLEGEDEEIGESDSKLMKAKTNARRRALVYHLSHEEIVRDVCKQYPNFCDQAEDIASKALLWIEKYQPGCEVFVNGIPKTITDMLSLDSRFAQLEAPGQPCVTVNRQDAQPISTADFNKRLSGEVVVIGVDEKGQPKYSAANKFWEGNTHKYIYRNIVFTNKPTGNDTYNLFTGFGVKPKTGSCEKILFHIFDVICARNSINYTAFLQLLAWQMQNIGKPSRIITALKSKVQQVGKGCLLGDILGAMYGNSGFTTSDIGQIIGRFNDTIRGKAFIFLDECLFAGDRKAADAIKSLATATRVGVESKGIPTVQFPSAVNLFLSTNHDDAAHIEEADARYWILEVSPHRAGDTDYFRDLYVEIENGGREAFMHHLLTTDVKSFVPQRDVPTDNEAKKAMIWNSINPYDARKWLAECCRAEMILGLKPIDKDSKLAWEYWQKGNEYVNGEFQTAYSEWQKTIKSPVAPKPTPSNTFGELLNKAGLELRIIEKTRRRTLPDINQCLEIVTGMIEKGG